MIFPHHTIHLVAKTYHDIAQHTVVHIKTALPDHLSWIDAQLISLLDVIVQQRCQKIVGGGDGMKISGKMKIQILHGNYLSITAACGAALDSKAGT